MAGAGPIIIFVVSFVGCALWSMMFLTFASHYFLVTIIDSSSGNDEVHFPSEGIMDWWWKPLFCLWILAFWILTGSILFSFLAFHPRAFAICLTALVWVMFPLGVLSALFTSNWFFFLHPVLFWRMLKHTSAFAYVHLITLISTGFAAGLVYAALTRSFIWALPAAFIVPTAILFYARHWGRFAWLAVHFLPGARRRSEFVDTTKDRPAQEEIPEMTVQEVDETSEAIQAGLPAKYPGIQIGTSVRVPSPPVNNDEEDEWATDKQPYRIIGEEPLPAIEEPTPAVAPAASMPAVEEEDEWAADKKPYVFAEPTPVPVQSAANSPVTASQYYQDRHIKETIANAKAKQAAGEHFMPKQSKKTPTFSAALFFGVWEFMVYQRTLRVWTNLVFFTIVELLFLLMVVQFWPNLD